MKPLAAPVLTAVVVMSAELAQAAYSADQMATGNLGIDFATDHQDEVRVDAISGNMTNSSTSLSTG